MSFYKAPIEKDCKCCIIDKHCECCVIEKDYHCPPPRHEQKIALNCGTGTGAVLPIVAGVLVSGAQVNGYYQTNPIVLGTVSLDTHWLNKPTVKVDFSSLISLRITSADFNILDYFFRLTFRLSKACECGPQIPLGTWNYELSNNLQARISIPEGIEQTSTVSESFGFTWCECQHCPGCCTYIVEVIDLQYYNIECASITNVGINAMAVGC